MEQSDQTRKMRIVLITGLFALVGFVLELGPVGGAFSLQLGGLPIFNALSLELVGLGFLAYLALAAAAAVGLHLGEEEPKPKEGQPPEEAAPSMVNPREGAAEGVRVRPELHQLRMLFTALVWYGVLKAVSLAIINGYLPSPGVAFTAFSFGLLFTAAGWLLLWQFLRWYAMEKRWIRLQDELIGGDVSRAIAILILIKPAAFAYGLAMRQLTWDSRLSPFTLALELLLVAAAVVLWGSRPATLRRTLTALAVIAVALTLVTLVLAFMERQVA